MGRKHLEMLSWFDAALSTYTAKWQAARERVFDRNYEEFIEQTTIHWRRNTDCGGPDVID